MVERVMVIKQNARNCASPFINCLPMELRALHSIIKRSACVNIWFTPFHGYCSAQTDTKKYFPNQLNYIRGIQSFYLLAQILIQKVISHPLAAKAISIWMAANLWLICLDSILLPLHSIAIRIPIKRDLHALFCRFLLLNDLIQLI